MIYLSVSHCKPRLASTHNEIITYVFGFVHIISALANDLIVVDQDTPDRNLSVFQCLFCLHGSWEVSQHCNPMMKMLRLLASEQRYFILTMSKVLSIHLSISSSLG